MATAIRYAPAGVTRHIGSVSMTTVLGVIVFAAMLAGVAFLWSQLD